MANYSLDPTAETLHGHFSRDRPPVLTVDPGDTVRFRTLDVGWGLENHHDTVSPRRKFEPREPGPALTGPVAIRGAEPGMTLAIHIEQVVPGPWGFTYAGGRGHFNRVFNQALGVADEPERLLKWTLDAEAMAGTNQHGHRVRLRPFPGMLGMPPGAPGEHSAWAPRATGGNMDCTAMTAGSVLYLPIEAPGGLVSVGDGHARQGDGEASGMAIECPMEAVVLRFELVEDFPIAVPHVRTPDGWVTLGFGETLEAASAGALEAMVELIVRRHGVHRVDALALASVVVDLRVTQLVNEVLGVHAVLADGAWLS